MQGTKVLPRVQTQKPLQPLFRGPKYFEGTNPETYTTSMQGTKVLRGYKPRNLYNLYVRIAKNSKNDNFEIQF
jgi:hypothetical protein